MKNWLLIGVPIEDFKANIYGGWGRGGGGIGVIRSQTDGYDLIKDIFGFEIHDFVGASMRVWACCPRKCILFLLEIGGCQPLHVN